MITTVNSVKLKGHNSPGQNLTASPWLTQLVSTREVVTASEWLQIMYHNITLRKCSAKPNVNPICRERRVGWEAGSGGKKQDTEDILNKRKGYTDMTFRPKSSFLAAWTLLFSAVFVDKWRVIKCKAILSLCDILLFKNVDELSSPQYCG